MWPRVMDCAKDWMGNTRKQIKRQLTRLKEFQRKGKLKQNRIHKKTPPETKRKPRHRSATQQRLSGEETMWLLPKRLSFKQPHRLLTASCSSPFVLLVRVVPTILRCSFPVCWSCARDVYQLQLAKFSAAERIRWSLNPVQSHPNNLYLVLKNCKGKGSGSALALAFSFVSVVIVFYLSSIFVSKGGNFAPDKNSWTQLVGKGRDVSQLVLRMEYGKFKCKACQPTCITEIISPLWITNWPRAADLL